MISFRALGSIAVTTAGTEVAIGGPRQRRLLAMLLVHRNAVVSSDQLIEAVFAGEPTPAAATTLRSYIARIRRVIESDSDAVRLETRAPGYRLVVPDDRFDVGIFESTIAATRTGAAMADPAGSAEALRAALDLWHGRAYGEFDDEDWVRPEAQRLGELRLVAHEVLLDIELGLGRSSEAVAELEALHDEYPLREAFTGQLMLALYRTGRHVQALRVFDAHRRLLADELGLDPSPKLVALEQGILDHDADLLESPPSGDMLRGYRLGERLGLGTDGTVVAVRVPGVRRDLAMRIIGPAVADDPAFVRTFERRMRTIAGIRADGIAEIHDYWRESGAAYIVTERLRGGSLADRLRNSPLTMSELRALVERIGGALVEAADREVAHGQITTRNVLFDHHGLPFLTDFSTQGFEASPHTDVIDFCGIVAAAGDDAARSALANALDRVRTGAPLPMAMVVDAMLGALTTGAADPIRFVNPYKGLHAFDEGDAEAFHGRELIVSEILERIPPGGGADRFVLLVGGSGTGKSSLVRAGLIPRVLDDEAIGAARRFVATMLPGALPFKEFVSSLGRVATGTTPTVEALMSDPAALHAAVAAALPEGGELLLVVDQFEELFTLTPDTERHAFLASLVDAIRRDDSKLAVVATLRGDFYDRPLGVAGFGSLVRACTLAMAAMTPAELEAAIVQPALRVGRNVEGSLVAELVGAAGTDAAILPALQFVLYELADHCGDTLTLAAYREIGGIAGAIAGRAEALFRSQPGDQHEVRRLFERLVIVAPDANTTRRPVPRQELVEGADRTETDIDDIIERWVAARLLTIDRDARSRLPSVEVAHEALLREWPRLRTWLDEGRHALSILGIVRSGAAEWESLDRDDGALLRGARLDTVEEVLATRPHGLSRAEAAFVDASCAARDAARRVEDDRIAAQARTNKRLRRQLAALGVALVVSIVAGVLTVSQWRAAEHERRVATARELAAEADAIVADDAEAAVRLALEAIDATGGGDDALPEAIEALHRAVTSSRLLLSVPGVGGALAWSADGSVFVTEGPEESGVVDIRDAESGESLRSWKGHDLDVNDVALSDDGSLVATAGDDNALRVWDVSTGELRWEHTLDVDGSVWGPGFSPDGTLVAAAWHADSTVRVFRIGEDEPIATFEAPSAATIRFDPAGRRIAWGRYDGPIASIADITTGETTVTVGEEERWIPEVAFSPDGTRLVTASGDGVARVWDSTTGALVMPVVGHRGPVEAVAWGPDGTTLATGSNDGTARVWDVGGSVARELVAVAGRETRNGVSGVAISPDGERLMTSDWAVTSTSIWDIGPLSGAEWMNGASRPESRADLVFADGAVGASVGRSVRLWDAHTGDVVADIGRGSATGPPDDPDEAVASIGEVLTVLYDGAIPIADKLELLDDPTGVAEAVDAVTDPAQVDAVATSRVAIIAIELVSADEARLRYDVFSDVGDLPGRFGAAVLTSDGWKITRETFCLDLSAIEIDCGQGNAASGRGAIDRVAATADGALLAISTGSYPVDVRDVATGELIVSVDSDDPTVFVIDLAWAPDGEHLAIIVGGDGCWISVVDRTGAEIARLEDPEGCLRTVEFSPDGRLLAATRWPDRQGAGSDGTHLWDWSTGDLLFTTEQAATDATFSPAGDLLATTTTLDASVYLWDTGSGTLVRSFETPAPSEDLAFAPGGSLLATGGLDGVVRLWQVDDGTVALALDARAAAIRSTAFSADGSQLASVDFDGIVRVWALDVDELVDVANRRLAGGALAS